MVRKSGSLKRVTRGLLGPKKKTLQRAKTGLQKQEKKALLKELAVAGRFEKLKTSEDILSALEKLKKSLYPISDKITDKHRLVSIRINIKYTLDSLNITGKKRERVFQIMEKMWNHRDLSKNGVAPVFVEELVEELGPTKSKMFGVLLKLKSRKINKYF